MERYEKFEFGRNISYDADDDDDDDDDDERIRFNVA